MLTQLLVFKFSSHGKQRRQRYLNLEVLFNLMTELAYSVSNINSITLLSGRSIEKC
ncbi:hypothetical protein C427_0259 [Paraglaciecola psychrophila 170]|uniref:Uncharacterized protein n=1 Tax=Paraglaciecola psychrophila 170 TaxID=1129794 RepID=K7AB33_9ALTE|nr:hypothetical protein C427_0259 [Paraglaciecola psychrophila 170]GAC37898.1 hypothetical protein GPSY_2277 [Paraglaciecola psychrophila 170]